MSGDNAAEPRSDVAIARIEATLTAIKNQIDYSERSSQQLVRLVDERFTARFDTLEKRLEEMDRARSTAREEHTREMERLKAEHDKDVADLATRLAATRGDVDALKSWKDNFTGRMIGIAIGIGLSSGAGFATVMRVVG